MGLLFLVLVFIGIVFLGAEPALEASPAEVSSFFAERSRSYQIGALMVSIGLVFFIWFASDLGDLIETATVGHRSSAAVVRSTGSAAALAGQVRNELVLGSRDGFAPGLGQRQRPQQLPLMGNRYRPVHLPSGLTTGAKSGTAPAGHDAARTCSAGRMRKVLGAGLGSGAGAAHQFGHRVLRYV